MKHIELRKDKAVRHFLRHGRQEHAIEQRDLITQNSTGQSVIPQEFSDAILEGQKYYAPLPTLVHRVPVAAGRPQKIGQSDFTSAGMSLVTEGTTAFTASTDPTVSSQINSLDTLAVLTKLSFQEIADSDFNLPDWFRTQVAPIVGRATEQALTLGTTNDGTNTALPNTTPLLPAITAAAGVTSTSIATTLSTANIVSLMGKVNRGYYPTASFMTSPSGWLALAGLNDSTGRPIFPVGNDGVLRVYGFEVNPNSAFPVSGTASGLQLAFGSWQHFYGLLDGQVSFRVLSERFAEKLESGILVYRRLSGLPFTGALASSVAGLFNAAA